MVRLFSVVAVLAVAGGWLAPTAPASGTWTRPAALQAPCARGALNCAIEPAPRIAINARGATAAAWIASDGRVHVATAGRDGHFSAAVAFERAYRPTVSISDRGAVTVAWSRNGLLRFVRRLPGHRFSRPATLVPRGSRLGDDFPYAVAEDDGATLVVYVNAYRTHDGTYVTRTRSVVVGGDGRPRRVVRVADGSPARDGFSATANGDAAVVTCCVANADGVSRNASVAVYAPGAGWRQVAPPLSTSEQVETVGPWRGDLTLGIVDVLHRGDSGSSGRPGLLRAGANGVFGPLLQAPVIKPGLAFGPVAAVDGKRRSILVYQEKDAPKAFSRVAPIYAVTAARSGAFGARQLLDRRLARFPQVAAYRDGALAVWEAPSHRWGVAVERGGTFRPAPAPAGGPSNVGEDFLRNRSLATAGQFAAVVWTARDGGIRASIAAGL
jgi:hypothetical protein